MNQINLLPLRLRERQATILLAWFALGAILLGGILVAGIWLPVKAEVTSLQQQVDEQKTQLVAQQEKEKAAQPKVDADLIARVNQLNTLSKTDVNWPRTFQTVDALVPKDIRITSFSLAFATGTATLKMGGDAPSNLSFAVFMESIRHNPMLTSLKVDGYTYIPTSGAVSFAWTSPIPTSYLDYSK